MMRQFFWSQLFVAANLLLVGAPAAAMDFQFGGFGTASLATFDNNTADFVVNDQPEGPGRTKRLAIGLDSSLGIQFDLGFSPAIDFGLQLVADQNTDRTYTPDVTVAQLRLRPSNALTVRLGRMPAGAFLYAETRPVRFAMPWVRPPLAVYGLVPTFSHDGLEIIHEGNLGRWSTELHGGTMHMKIASPLANDDRVFDVEAFGPFLNLTLLANQTQLKIGYSYGETSIPHPDAVDLFGALREFGGPAGADLADELDIDESPSHLFGFGVQHEQDGWLVVAEFGFRFIDGFFRDQYGAYVTLGKRLGPWLPYTTVARRSTGGPDTDSRAGFLESEVKMLLDATRYDTTSVVMGLSRELCEQARFKFQADRITPDDGSWGLYTNHGPNYDFADPGGNWLFTMSLDFVF